MVALQARYLLVVGLAVVLGLSVAVPVFAAGGGITPQVVGGEPVSNGDFPRSATTGTEGRRTSGTTVEPP